MDRKSIAEGGLVLAILGIAVPSVARMWKASQDAHAREFVYAIDHRECEIHIHEESSGAATHVELNVPAITGAQVTATYVIGTALQNGNDWTPAIVSEPVVFTTLEALKAAPISHGCSMIRAVTQDGKAFSWEPRFGWECAEA